MFSKKIGISILGRKAERSQSFTMPKTPTESVGRSSEETHIDNPTKKSLKQRSSSFSNFDDKYFEKSPKQTTEVRNILESARKLFTESQSFSSISETAKEASEKLELSKKLLAENFQLRSSLEDSEKEITQLRSVNSTLTKKNQILTESRKSPRKPETYFASPFIDESLTADNLRTARSSDGEESDASPDSLMYSVSPNPKELKYTENVAPNNLTRDLCPEKLHYGEHIDGDLEAEDGDLEAEKDQQIEVLRTEIEKLNILLHQARTEKLDDEFTKNLKLLLKEKSAAVQQVNASKALLEELYNEELEESLEQVVLKVIIELEGEKEQRQKLLAKNKILEDELKITQKENTETKTASKLLKNELEENVEYVARYEKLIHDNKTKYLNSLTDCDLQINQLQSDLIKAVSEKDKQESLLGKEKEKYKKLLKEGNEERSSYFAESEENKKKLRDLKEKLLEAQKKLELEEGYYKELDSSADRSLSEIETLKQKLKKSEDSNKHLRSINKRRSEELAISEEAREEAVQKLITSQRNSIILPISSAASLQIEKLKEDKANLTVQLEAAIEQRDEALEQKKESDLGLATFREKHRFSLLSESKKDGQNSQIDELQNKLIEEESKRIRAELEFELAKKQYQDDAKQKLALILEENRKLYEALQKAAKEKEDASLASSEAEEEVDNAAERNRRLNERATNAENLSRELALERIAANDARNLALAGADRLQREKADIELERNTALDDLANKEIERLAAVEAQRLAEEEVVYTVERNRILNERVTDARNSSQEFALEKIAANAARDLALADVAKIQAEKAAAELEKNTALADLANKEKERLDAIAAKKLAEEREAAKEIERANEQSLKDLSLAEAARIKKEKEDAEMAMKLALDSLAALEKESEDLRLNSEKELLEAKLRRDEDLARIEKLQKELEEKSQAPSHKIIREFEKTGSFSK